VSKNNGAKPWHITDILTAPAVGACYDEDPAFLQAQSQPSSDPHPARLESVGFQAAQGFAQVISVGLVLNDRSVAWGDCVGICRGGAAGDDAIVHLQEGLVTIRGAVGPALRGRQVTSFRQLAAEMDALTESVQVSRSLPRPKAHPSMSQWSRRDLLAAPVRLWRATQEDEKVATEQVTVDRRLHTAVRYGVSQAVLKAVALARGVTMAEVIAEEWGLPPPGDPVPIHGRCGVDWHDGAEKLVLRRVASLPHAAVDDIPEQLGEDGTKLTRYVRWLRQRIRRLGGPDYQPTIHLDVRGALGHVSENDLGRVLGHLYALDLAAQPYPLRVESPVIMESREAQIEAMKTLRDYVRFRKINTQLVVHEWVNSLDDVKAFVEAQAADMVHIKMPDLGCVHNSVDAVLACKDGGIATLLGGSCAETDLSARVTTHVALATRPDILMAKPGMGVDEAIAPVQNEMNRTLARIDGQRGE